MFTSESLWMYTENDLTKIKEDIQQTNFNTKYLTDLERIHNYIEQYQFGVGVTDLMVKSLIFSTYLSA